LSKLISIFSKLFHFTKYIFKKWELETVASSQSDDDQKSVNEENSKTAENGGIDGLDRIHLKQLTNDSSIFTEKS